MSYDYTLGFRARPADLDEILLGRGFQLGKITPADDQFPVEMRHYSHFEDGRSARGVHITYHDGVYADSEEVWPRTVDDPRKIVATATVTTSMGRNRYDGAKQAEIAKFLRDHCQAVLYDPQAGKLVAD